MLMGRWQQHLTSAWPQPLPPSMRGEHQAASQVRKAQLIWAALSAIWTGLHISFLTPSIVESSLDVIGSLFPQPNLPFPILISVGRKICSCNWPETNHILYSSVVLDSSEGRSSEPLMDGSDFLEALTKKVDSPIQTEPPMENYEAWWWKTFKGTWGSSSLELGNISWARPCVGKNWPGGNPQGVPQYCEKRSWYVWYRVSKLPDLKAYLTASIRSQKVCQSRRWALVKIVPENIVISGNKATFHWFNSDRCALPSFWTKSWSELK